MSGIKYHIHHFLEQNVISANMQRYGNIFIEFSLTLDRCTFAQWYILNIVEEYFILSHEFKCKRLWNNDFGRKKIIFFVKVVYIHENLCQKNIIRRGCVFRWLSRYNITRARNDFIYETSLLTAWDNIMPVIISVFVLVLALL